MTYKFESLAELKFDPWFRVIGEYLSQMDNLTLNIESIWLKYSPITLKPGSNFSSASDGQFDSEYRVNLTQILDNWTIWLWISSQFDSNILQLLWNPGRILVPLVTQICRSKWLHFSFQWCTILPLSYMLRILRVHGRPQRRVLQVVRQRRFRVRSNAIRSTTLQRPPTILSGKLLAKHRTRGEYSGIKWNLLA